MIRLIAIIAALLLMVTGCEREGATGREGADRPHSVRIVSLSPAISRTLVDFELQKHIVGRTPHCHSLDQSIPVVGDLLYVNYEQLVRLNPTHLLVQPPASGIDQHLVELAEEHGWTLAQWRLNNIDDIEKLVRDLPLTLFPGGTTEIERSGQRSAEILNRIANALSPAGQPLFKGRTLIVNAVNPVLAAGSDTYLNDVLVALGGVNATSAQGWFVLSLEDVIRLDPQAIIVIKPSAETTVNVADAAGPLGDLDIAAVRDHRIAILTHPDALMPSSAVADVAGELRRILRELNEKSR